jgi:hypothetical protein
LLWQLKRAPSLKLAHAFVAPLAHAVTFSAEATWSSIAFSASLTWTILRPSPVSYSAADALTSGSAAASALTLVRAPPAAMLYLSVPQRPLGSAAITAIAASIGASMSFFHSSAAGQCRCP